MYRKSSNSRLPSHKRSLIGQNLPAISASPQIEISAPGANSRLYGMYVM